MAAPPLPPRTAVPAPGNNVNHFSPTSDSRPGPSPYLGGLNDSRASSTQSLQPVESAGENRRILLLIYIHGFLGDQTSFQSFPAHVHNLLTPALAATHVVYTKIYPRYKSRKNISFARDAFSNWLAPHESSTTDIILVGHSLGGILAAEVVLTPSNSTSGNNDLFQHRLLGLIAFDTPFLGMHPGVVGTGIASLFRTIPQPPIIPPANPEMFSDTAPQVPTYNPMYPNDVNMVEKKGKFQKFWYFWNKHCGELVKATGDYLSSHLEFGGCLADYPGLKRRYNTLRPLEDVDETYWQRTPDGKLMKRVRFVNYYSASTGPIKERSPSPSSQRAMLEPPSTDSQQTTTRRSSTESVHPSTVSSPRLSLEERRDGEVITKDIAELNMDPDPPVLTPATTALSPTTTLSELVPTSTTGESTSSSADASIELGLPPLPPLPARPSEFDGTQIEDEDTRNLLRKEHERKIKAHDRAVKDREDVIKDREKLLQKRRRNFIKQQEKGAKQAKEQEAQSLKEQSKQAATLNPDTNDGHLQREAGVKPQAEKKQKDRKFCALPPKDSRTGSRDLTWIRIFFEGIDEVTAHTSMFKVSETYAKMVGDVVERVETWIAEDASTRMILAEIEQVD